MKMTTEHLAMLRKALSGESLGTTERDRWGALWRVVDAGTVLTRLSQEAPFDYREVLWDYTDAHIDTALRTLQQERKAGGKVK